MLHDPFYASFAFGASSIISATGMMLDIVALLIFDVDATTLSLFVMDLFLFLNTQFYNFGYQTKDFWIQISFYYALYLMSFSLYGFIRVYNMINKKLKISAFFASVVTYVGSVVFALSVRTDLISEYVGVIVLGIVIPFWFVILAFVAYNVISLISSNPIYKSSKKQSNLVKINFVTAIVSISICLPCFMSLLLSGILSSDFLLEFGIFTVPFITQTFTISNFAILMNREIPDGVVVNSDVFEL